MKTEDKKQQDADKEAAPAAAQTQTVGSEAEAETLRAQDRMVDPDTLDPETLFPPLEGFSRDPEDEPDAAAPAPEVTAPAPEAPSPAEESAPPADADDTATETAAETAEASQDAPPPAETDPQETAQERTKRPVILYISVLFVAAVVLILLSFFMQQRNHEAVMSGLSATQENLQTLTDLERNNALLENKVAELEQQLAQATEDTQSKVQGALAEQYKVALANALLTEMQAAYDEQNYTLAKKLLGHFEERELQNVLSTEAAIAQLLAAQGGAEAAGYVQNELVSPRLRYDGLKSQLADKN